MRTRQPLIPVLAAGCLISLALAGCGGSDTPAPGTGDGPGGNANAISILIGSSGQAETAAVEAAVAAWSAQSGVATKVIAASDLNQEAAQGFASGQPADLLYLSTENLAAWAANGSLEAYGDQLANKDDFYPSLREAFTVDGVFYAAPKDFSTLALVVNTDMWAAAGLTEADYPTTWDELETVAKALTTDGHIGLTFGAELQRIGVFLAQAGGGIVTDDQATANSQANIDALAYVQKLLNEGCADFASDLGAGWGGEALGKELAAMVIEGNWITGAMAGDYGNINYTVIELPAGVQQGTIQYTNAWGLAADGSNKANAIKLVEYLTSTEQQVEFAKTFGVMPSVESARNQFTELFPEMTAFMAGADYAQNLPAQTGVAAVISDFNSTLGTLKTADPKSLLDNLQTNLEAVIG